MATCTHARTKVGKNAPRRYGSWATEVCRDCGAFRTKDHHGGHVSPWHPREEYEAAVAEWELD